MKRGWLLVAAAFGMVVTSAAFADTVLVTKFHQDALDSAVGSSPAQDEQQTLWIGTDRARQDQGDSTMLLRQDLKKLFLIDHKQKKAQSVDLPVDLKKLLPGDLAAMATQMIDMMKLEAKVTPTATSKKIGSWNTALTELTVSSAMGFNSTVKLWLSKEIKFNQAMYQTLLTNLGDLGQMNGWMKELAKIQGYPVLIETTMEVMGSTVTSRAELLSSSEKAAPAGHYDLPAGYAVTPLQISLGGGDES